MADRANRVDPLTASLAVFAALVAGGFVAMVLAWRLVSDAPLVGAQVPPIVSGGLGGIALVTLGVGLAMVQLERQRAADERGEIERLLGELERLADVIEHRGGGADA